MIEATKSLVMFNEKALDRIVKMLTKEQREELIAITAEEEKQERILRLEASIARQQVELAELKK